MIARRPAKRLRAVKPKQTKGIVGRKSVLGRGIRELSAGERLLHAQRLGVLWGEKGRKPSPEGERVYMGARLPSQKMVKQMEELWNLAAELPFEPNDKATLERIRRRINEGSWKNTDRINLEGLHRKYAGRRA